MDHPSPPHGVMEHLEPGIRRIIAPNPSPMTYWGTNTFILGEGRVAVVDPGPRLPGHMQAILDGLSPDETVAAILVTHTHSDHSPLARPLAEATGAPVLGYGDARAGRSDVMTALVAAGVTSGGESVELDFFPDELLQDGESFDVGDVAIEAIWTPGHFSNHLSFAVSDAVLVGDHVMAWASTLVSPPDGDLTAFLWSCDRLMARNDRIHYPAHGPAITDPKARLTWLVDHRRGREADILAALEVPSDIPTLTRQIYTDVNPALLGAAERNVFAHLIDLTTRGVTRAAPNLSATATYELNRVKDL